MRRMIQNRIIQSASFNLDEIIVSNILLNLKGLIEESESRSRVPPLKLSSSKRRRCDRNLGFNSSSQRNSQVEEDEDEKHSFEIESKSVKLQSKATSDSRLSFSPIEFDDKPKQYSFGNQKNIKRKTREKLMHNIEKLTRGIEPLRREVEKVQGYYNKQKAYNLELKATREKVMTNLNRQEQGTSHMLQYPMGQLLQAQPFPSSAYGLGSVNHTGPMGQLSEAQPMPSSANGLGFVNHTDPVICIPNFNGLTMNSMSPYEHNRDIAERKAQYTEDSRKTRTKRIKTKRSSGLIRSPKR